MSRHKKVSADFRESTRDVGQSVTARNFQAVLDSLKNEYKKNLSGHNERTYTLMARALRVALFLRSNKKEEERFLHRVKTKRSSGGVPINVVTEAMVYVAGATSESARKIAWRRGRVIEFLHNAGIKVSKIASEIRTRGGVNAVLKQATKENPRRQNMAPGDTAGSRVTKPPMVKTSDKERDTSGSDDAKVSEAKAARGAQRNDGKVIMSVLIDLSDRDMLLELPPRSRVKMYATCGSQTQAKIEVSEVKKLKPKAREENDSDW